MPLSHFKYLNLLPKSHNGPPVKINHATQLILPMV